MFEPLVKIHLFRLARAYTAASRNDCTKDLAAGAVTGEDHDQITRRPSAPQLWTVLTGSVLTSGPRHSY